VRLVGWITAYQRAWLRDDVVSGVVVGLIMIPVAMAYAQMAGVPPQAILLDLSASADLDIGTADMLRDLYRDLRTKQIDLLFAQIRGSVRDRMTKTGLLEHLGEDHLYPSIAAAVAAFQARPASAEALATPPPEPA
jgi:MFS superfamily sulfate permease-like transporter